MAKVTTASGEVIKVPNPLPFDHNPLKQSVNCGIYR